MAQCTFMKPDDTRCKGVATRASGASQLCAAHDPATQERRKAGASKGGQGGSAATKEARGIRSEVKDLIGAVERGEIPTARAAIMGQLYNVLLRSLEQERKWTELDEVREELRLIKEALG